MKTFKAIMVGFFCLLLVAPVCVRAQTDEDQRIGQTTCYNDDAFIISCAVILGDEDVEPVLPSRFTDNGDDTVNDELLGAVWKKDENGSIRLWVEKREPRFIDHNDGTMTDIDTGLVWLQDANCIASTYPIFDQVEKEEDGRISWKQARTFIDRINDGRYFECNAGYTDWRLPDLQELLSLVEDGDDKVKDTLLEQGFINVSSVYYWSSTENLVNIYFAWAVSMQNGRVTNLPKSMGLGVWPVRSPTADKEADKENEKEEEQ